MSSSLGSRGVKLDPAILTKVHPAPTPVKFTRIICDRSAEKKYQPDDKNKRNLLGNPNDGPVHAVRWNKSIRTPTTQPKTYYVSGGNGAAMVEAVLNRLGWVRCLDKDSAVQFRWVQCHQQIHYADFKEGLHLVNHIPNCGILTNKLGLLLSLRDYERRYQLRYGRAPAVSMHDFFPETYIADDPVERDAFYAAYESSETKVWISKPIAMNQGKGIFLVRDINVFKTALEDRDNEAKTLSIGLPPRLIQKYIAHPLLVNGHKFDIRCYALIANAMPYLVLYHPGYVRLSAHSYHLRDDNLQTHLTNQYIQKKSPNYAQVKNETVWTIDQLNDYINRYYRVSKCLPFDWVKTVLQYRIRRIIHRTFLAVKNRLATRLGMFQLYGLDFLLDDQFQPWLLEVNSNPAMATNCDALKSVLPDLVEKSIQIVLECFEKAQQGKPLLPMNGPLDRNSSSHSFELEITDDVDTGEKTDPSKLLDRLRLPEGFVLIYKESDAAFRARWPMAQSTPLRGWVAPRFKPPVSPPNRSCTGTPRSARPEISGQDAGKRNVAKNLDCVSVNQLSLRRLRSSSKAAQSFQLGEHIIRNSLLRRESSLITHQKKVLPPKVDQVGRQVSLPASVSLIRIDADNPVQATKGFIPKFRVPAAGLHTDIHDRLRRSISLNGVARDSCDALNQTVSNRKPALAKLIPEEVRRDLGNRLRPLLVVPTFNDMKQGPKEDQFAQPDGICELRPTAVPAQELVNTLQVDAISTPIKPYTTATSPEEELSVHS
ncbi:Protein polyglycylase ttll10 [Clonorchis sinensis]|uniref:Protein polyglycylase ttll10 n=1 Tax=Clonorchis sinensis TaxID=79923 RepID=A0A419PWG6_CLOSI|nr:Protein polyglycylase ttll10 [Clonorchis sinensis]